MRVGENDGSPQTKSAPYLSAIRRVGSSPVRTIGASTHSGRGRPWKMVVEVIVE